MVAALARISLGSWLMGFRGCWPPEHSPASRRWQAPSRWGPPRGRHAVESGCTKRGTMALVLSDPTYAPREAPSPFDRMASRFLRDNRDLPFLWLMALLTATVVPTGVLLFLPGPFRWGLAALHL